MNEWLQPLPFHLAVTCIAVWMIGGIYFLFNVIKKRLKIMENA
jgi:hypothetical protein